MNLSDLYAIGCLLLWGGLAGYTIWIFRRKPPRGQESGEKFSVGTALLAVLLSCILYSILLIGNPNYLAVARFDCCDTDLGPPSSVRSDCIYCSTLFVKTDSFQLIILSESEGYRHFPPSNRRRKIKLFILPGYWTRTIQP